MHIKRCLHCSFNGYNRVNIYKRRPEVLSTTPHTSAPSSPPSYTLHISHILPNIPSHYIAFVFYSVLATFRLQHIKRRLHCSFNGYKRVNIYKRRTIQHLDLAPPCPFFHSFSLLLLFSLPFSLTSLTFPSSLLPSLIAHYIIAF